MFTKVKTEDEIEAMRFGGKVLSKVLQAVRDSITPGITGRAVDEIAKREIKGFGVKAAFLGFQGFPASICLSINDEVVHGIPTEDKVIKSGDVVSLDLGISHRGLIVDGAITIIAGPPLSQDDPRQKLLETTELSLKKGLKSVKSGARIGDISSSIQSVLEDDNVGIVKELVGHGVGHELHEDPNIPNFGERGTGKKLEAGMTIAVEPMATTGKGDIYVDTDGWTVKTRDGSIAAQFEHTVLVTDKGREILTVS